MKVIFEFVDAKNARPVKSGEYLCANKIVGEGGKEGIRFLSLPYSRVHDAFNSHDSDSNTEYAFEPDMWAWVVSNEIELEDDGNV